MLVYLHIPFCDSKCHYCGFNSFSSLHELKNSYSLAMIKQLKNQIELFNLQKNSVSSVFIGGGTPSCMEACYFEKFFKILNPYLAEFCEITTEANPTSASKQWLLQMREFGVNRVSFGVQSFYDDKLKFLGRNHSSDEAKKVVQNAKNIGFEDISIDLIYGSKFDDKKRLLNELDCALNLPINHLSAYSLTLEENTPFFGKEKYLNRDFRLGELVSEQIVKRGFEWYEVSNFGKKRCKHNFGYWQHKNYLGIGAGAVGFKDDFRIYPTKDVKEYIKNPYVFEKEHLSKEELQIEKIFLGFRSVVGVEKDLLNDAQIQKADFLVKEKKLFFKKGRYFCNDFFIADEIALYLMH